MKATQFLEAANIKENRSQLMPKEHESLYEQRVPSNDNIKSLVKTKRISKVKMAEVLKISSRLREFSLRFTPYKKHNLSIKEVSKIKSDLKFLFSTELSYQLVEKSKIGKSLALFLQK